MPRSDAPQRFPAFRDSAGSCTAARPLGARLISVALMLAALGLWCAPALNVAGFHAINALGPLAPALWSSLSVAGLGLSAWIYLTAFAAFDPARVARLLWILVVGGLVVHLIKHSMPMPRPLLALGANHLHIVGEGLRTRSIPSGHSAMAFALLPLIWNRCGKAPVGTLEPASAPPWLARTMWIALAIGIALSRIAVGAHWPCDVLLGASLGLIFGQLSTRAWPTAVLSRWLMSCTAQRCMAAGLLISACAIGATPTVLDLLGLTGTWAAKRLATGYPLAEPLQWALALLALAGSRHWWRASCRATRRNAA